MTSLYELTIPFLIKALKTEQTLLAKAEAFEGASIDDLVNTTFATEPAKMWPLWKQIAISALHAQVTVGSFRKTTPKHYDIRAETSMWAIFLSYPSQPVLMYHVE
ncbi:hypothetical protein RRF57_006013 [Xylaria bambusicola]|uniref:Uncharacterized protein n=1 Tax=Xylaria bambusicola TaxID=326684 RepID=A0AAN7UIQ6_9PEZI